MGPARAEIDWRGYELELEVLSGPPEFPEFPPAAVKVTASGLEPRPRVASIITYPLEPELLAELLVEDEELVELVEESASEVILRLIRSRCPFCAPDETCGLCLGITTEEPPYAH